MSRPSTIDLTNLDASRWRRVPMEGANGGIDVIPLASRPDAFTIVARFPAGFERPTPGGYLASEEFLVLDGELELEGATYRRGDLTVVPPQFLRTSMRAPSGCTALAWFGGPADFLPPSDLEPTTEPITSMAVRSDEPLPSSAVATWARTAVGSGEFLEVVTTDLTRWERLDLAEGAAVDGLIRRTR